MRVFLTGGTGFIGGAIARKLRERGDDVVAMVRSTARATALEGLGCELRQGDIADSFSIERALEGCDTAIHCAGRYEVGIKKSECPQMQDANIGGTRHVLNAAIDAGMSKIVYASTVSVFGNTKGERVKETYRRNPLDGFMSCYDESKYRAHVLAETRFHQGAPIVLVQPAAVYGPGDHSEVGRQMLLAAREQLPALMLTNIGLTMAHVDDVADGFIRALDSGKVGESYSLGGESVRAIDLLKKAAEFAGRPLPRRTVSTGLLKFIAPVAPFIGPRMGYPPNLAEVIRSADGVTYWCDDTKAREELGYTSRPLDDGIKQTLAAAGIPLADSAAS